MRMNQAQSNKCIISKAMARCDHKWHTSTVHVNYNSRESSSHWDKCWYIKLGTVTGRLTIIGPMADN